jgi:hypothetical protein
MTGTMNLFFFLLLLLPFFSTCWSVAPLLRPPLHVFQGHRQSIITRKKKGKKPKEEEEEKANKMLLLLRVAQRVRGQHIFVKEKRTDMLTTAKTSCANRSNLTHSRETTKRKYLIISSLMFLRFSAKTCSYYVLQQVYPLF